MEIARGTRVSVSRSDSGGEPPIFVTAHDAFIPAGEEHVDVLAYHCDLVEAELAGKGTGDRGFSVKAKRPPIIRRTGDELDLIVGVEAVADELQEGVPARQYSSKTLPRVA